ncbi:Zinc finger protein 254-like 2, partial [Homarus americanus]
MVVHTVRRILSGKSYYRKYELKNHMVVHTGEKNFKCKEYTLVRKILCEEVVKVITEKDNLKQHMVVHTVRRNLSVKREDKLKQHMVEHTGEKNFKCKGVVKVITEKAISSSIWLSHTGEECGKSYYTLTELHKHMVVHTGEKNLCEECGKVISEKVNCIIIWLNTLERRILSVKTVVKVISENMNFRIIWLNTLVRKILSVKSVVKVYTKTPSKETYECGKSYYRNDQLQMHMVLHTGEKNFKCEECGKRYRKGDLNRHMVRHTTEKNFKCEKCGKGYYKIPSEETYDAYGFTHNEKNFKCEEVV